jgi:hypothetical protein
VARAVREALASHFADASRCVVVVDTGAGESRMTEVRQTLDPVAEVVTVAPVERAPDPLTLPYHGMWGRAEAIRAVLSAARDRQAPCVFLDGGLIDCPPDWLARLAEPIAAGGFDFVSAYYLRHPVEGAITKSIVAPMFRALYGVRLRQPAATEFACSARLADHALDQPFWTAELADAGIDMWIGSDAVANGFRVCEAVLGVRTTAPRPDQPELSTAIQQVVGSLFRDLDAHQEFWQRTRGSQMVPVFGTPPAVTLPAPEIGVERLVESYRLGYDALHEIWAWIVPPRTILRLRRLAAEPPDRFQFEDDLWVQVIYDFAAAHRQAAMPRDHLLGALTPLYLGWLASYVRAVRDVSPDVAEARLERLAEMFEAQKPHLISRWRWPERFRA